MITQPAKVIDAFDSYCLVETIPKSACPRCAQGKGCGGGILAQAFANKIYRLRVPYTSECDDDPVGVGSDVLLGMNSNGLLMASLVLYLLPLLTMISVTLLTALYINNSDVYTVAAAATGLAIGALGASIISKRLIRSGMTQAQIIQNKQVNCWYPAP